MTVRPAGPLAAVLLFALAVPFDPHWFDAEFARRGLLSFLVGAGLLLAPSWWRPDRGAWQSKAVRYSLAAFIGWIWFRTFTAAPHPAWGIGRAVHLTTVASLLVLGARIGSAAPGCRRGLPKDLHATAVTALAPALAAVAFYGFYEAFVLGTPPASTLRNLNVSSEFTAVAAAGLLATTAPAGWRSRLSDFGIALAAGYLILNGSRGGAIVFGLVAALASLRPETRVARRVVLLVAGTTVALVPTLNRLSPNTAATQPAAEATATESPSPEVTVRPNTLRVRQLLWQATGSMIAAAPLTGHGTGQFALDFPRYRCPEEIEISSFGRQFATEVETPHNDLLEITAEGGFIALGLLATVLWNIARSIARDHGWRTALTANLPVLAVGLLGLTRSPLGNAPVVAIAAFWLGASMSGSSQTADPELPMSNAARAGRVLLGLLFVVLGFATVAGQTLAAGYTRSIAEHGRPTSAGVEALEQAISVDLADPRLRRLHARARFLAAQAEGADGMRMLGVAKRLKPRMRWLRLHTPDSPGSLSLAADIAVTLQELSLARGVFEHWRKIDPHDPEAQLGLAVTLVSIGGDDHISLAIDVLYDAPHPRLRATLPEHFRDLSRLRANRGDSDAARRLLGEAAFLDAAAATAARARVSRIGTPRPAGRRRAARRCRGCDAALGATRPTGRSAASRCRSRRRRPRDGTEVRRSNPPQRARSEACGGGRTHPPSTRSRKHRCVGAGASAHRGAIPGRAEPLIVP